ncbi:MAG: hypothetical protein ACRD1R_03110 [Acidobacteriota bacterium]
MTKCLTLIFLVLGFTPKSIIAQESESAVSGQESAVSGQRSAVSGQGSAVSGQPSLVELARRTREQKAANRSPVRVITNQDLKTFENAPVSVSKSARPAPSTDVKVEDDPAASPEPTEVQGVDQNAPDLEFWKQAFAEARLNLKNAINRGLVLQLRMNNLRNAFLSEDDGSTQGAIQAELQQTLQEITQSNLEIEAAQAALATLQREAALAGLLPGQIRELTGEVEDTEAIITPTSVAP